MRKIRMVFAVLFLPCLCFLNVFIFSPRTHATASVLTFTSVRNGSTVSIAPSSNSGTFATSTNNQKAEFSISTNNVTGYTLLIKSATNNTNLSNGDFSLSSIGSITSLSNYSNSNNTQYNNTWGILPNKYVSSNAVINNTTNYLPAPSTTSTTLNNTSSANSANGTSNPDSYTIGLGTRINENATPGAYTATLILEYVANPTPYTITYHANDGSGTPAGNSVSNLPAAQSGNVQADSQSSVTLSNNIPTRSGYIFNGWCGSTTANSDGTGRCNDSVHQAGSTYTIKSTSGSQSIVLYAMWRSSGTLYMQDIYATNKDTLCPTGTNTTVYDARDNKQYTIKQIDGVCTMTKNLQYIGGTNGAVSIGDGVNSAGETFTMTENTTSHRTYPRYKISDNSDYGVYYNYAAASGGTATEASGPIGATTSICPAGWSLPSSSASTWGGMSFTSLASSNDFNVLAGYYHNVNTTDGNNLSLKNAGTDGYWWSSGASSKENYYNLYLSSGTFSTDSSGKSLYMLPIRCILSPDPIAENLTAMQSITQANKDTLCPANTETRVYDNRDNRVYTVTQIDGVCTMTKNLQYTGGSNGTISKTSAVNSDGDTFNIEASAVTALDGARYVETGRDDYGTYYNYTAASGGTIINTTEPISTSTSICPVGWSLPGAGVDSWGNMSFTSMTSNGSFNILSGYYYNVNTTNGNKTKIKDSGSIGYWWANGPVSSGTYYDLNVTSAGVFSTAGSIKNLYLLPIRCVLSPNPILENLTAMQDITPSNKNTLCPANTETRVYDNRDNKVYTVTQIDDVCTMTKNLQYTGGEDGVMSKTAGINSDGNSITLSASTSTSTSDLYYVESGREDAGTYYNYAAASGGSITSGAYISATTSICPIG